MGNSTPRTRRVARGARQSRNLGLIDISHDDLNVRCSVLDLGVFQLNNAWMTSLDGVFVGTADSKAVGRA